MGSGAGITHGHSKNAVLVTEQTVRGRELLSLLAVLLEDVLPVMGLLQEFGNIDLAFHECANKRKNNIKSVATIRPQSPNEGFQNVTELLRIRASMNGGRLLVVA